MPRKPREQSVTGIYHVMCRGNEGHAIFHEPVDYQMFLHFIALYQDEERKKIQQSADAVPDGGLPDITTPGSSLEIYDDEIKVPIIFAYCLMTNHIHMLVREGKTGISAFMKKVCQMYAGWYHRKYKKVGHFFQDRFLSKPVNDEEYFLTVYRYIVRNPIKAGITEKYGDYPWCNYPWRILPDDAEDLDSVPSKKTITEYCHDSMAETELFDFRISDEEAINICETLVGIPMTQIPALDKDIRKAVIRRLLLNRVHIKQISRLTGMPLSTLIRIKNL